MKSACFKFTQLLLLFTLLIATQTVTAQKKGTSKQSNKTEKAKSVKVGKRSSAAAIEAQLSGMTRADKNKMTHSPLTGKRMRLNKNYQADAEEQDGVEEFPFAAQLGYRRYCEVATRRYERAQKKNTKVTSDKGAIKNSTSSNEQTHCQIYGNVLLKNPDYDPSKEIKQVDPETPNAKQYGQKNYCKACTKIYKIRQKKQ